MNWQELSDRKLVELCLQGIEDAWAELLRRYRRLIARVAAKTIRGIHPVTSSVLEDLIQDSLARIVANDCRALRDLEWLHEGSLRGLLQKTASTAAQDYLRKQLSEKRNIWNEVSLEEPDLVLPTSEDSSATLQQKILLDQLARCLEKLIRSEADCTRDVAIFRLFYGYRITAADLSRFYEMNLRKVENTLARLGRLARSHCL
ncbi:MAG: RNA polymerase sigma factor [Candidatus Angelobacter sp.]